MLAISALAPIFLPARAFAASGETFAPPIAVPMLFTRTLQRSLFDGAKITVVRSFVILFERVGAGFGVSGEQNEVTVSAPPALDSFAEIERQRVDSQGLPLQLGANGWIMGSSAQGDRAAMNSALAQALEVIRSAGLQQDEAEQARAFLASMQSAALEATASPPADLFCPPAEIRTAQQVVPLPEAREGAITVSFYGTKSPVSGLMTSAERTAVTSLDGQIRTSLERWTLAPHE